MNFVGSQGAYGRLLQSLLDSDNPDDVEEWLSQFHDCTDCVDFVMKLEG